MGIDTTIIAEHSVDNLNIVPDLLEDCDELFVKHHKVIKKHWNASFNPVKKYYIQNLRIKPKLTWQWFHPHHDCLELNGPLGFGLCFRVQNLFDIDVPPRWSWIIDDKEVQNAIVEIVDCIVKSLGGSKHIYVPSSYYCSSLAADEYQNNSSIEDVEQFLLKKCGEPKNSLSSIRRMFTDEEMKVSLYDWDGTEDSRAYEDDGYFVRVL